ncbi:hypothetical protein [Larkinella soli]|uniref:hypothetical protein n=1 Tax=Larkinella soli TaxID=1770527 RepID=UPI000FFB1424|nr:hypothetical protein [Larkinella soli]
MRRFCRWGAALLLAALVGLALPECFHENRGQSRTYGTVGAGKLERPYLVPFSGRNFRYFSYISYYLWDNAYTHSQVCRTIVEAYRTCEETCPGSQFQLMECSNRRGGESCCITPTGTA